jgi:DNA-binding IclR family transcriptional regulator
MSAVQTIEPMAPRPQYPIEVVDKALQMLNLFRDQPQLRLADARDALGLTQSRAHRLMAMLVYHGFAVQDPLTRAYRPGPALIDLGLSVIRGMDLRSVARPVLEELAAEVGETIGLGMLEGAEVRYIDGIESELALRVANRIGRLLPAHATSIGKVLLSELSEETLRALYPSERLMPVTAKTIVRRSELEEELRLVRSRGYAVNSSESEEGVCSIAMAIRDPVRGAIAAVSIAAPIGRLPMTQAETMAKRLAAAVARISERIAKAPHLTPITMDRVRAR